MTSGSSVRSRAKADRHAALLTEAARLFARNGYSGVSLEELGAAVGVSGPAVYRHFANKQALLAAILVGVSERLLAGGNEVVERESDADDRLRGLVAFHVDFALAEADVIRVQDRELASLHEDDRHTVRRLQREYVETWIGVMGELHPTREEGELRVRANACFGLINSTPHSVRDARGVPGDDAVRGILESMAFASLTA
jgi:AcrR family transcriptional regulator